MTAAAAARQVMQFILHSFLAPTPPSLLSLCYALSILTATRLQYAEQFEQQQQQQ